MAQIGGVQVAVDLVLAVADLFDSKLRSARPKDFLDVHELRRLHGTI